MVFHVIFEVLNGIGQQLKLPVYFRLDPCRVSGIIRKTDTENNRIASYLNLWIAAGAVCGWAKSP
jgi:hypothetical protein